MWSAEIYKVNRVKIYLSGLLFTVILLSTCVNVYAIDNSLCTNDKLLVGADNPAAKERERSKCMRLAAVNDLWQDMQKQATEVSEDKAKNVDGLVNKRDNRITKEQGKILSQKQKEKEVMRNEYILDKERLREQREKAVENNAYGEIRQISKEIINLKRSYRKQNREMDNKYRKELVQSHKEITSCYGKAMADETDNERYIKRRLGRQFIHARKMIWNSVEKKDKPYAKEIGALIAKKKSISLKQMRDIEDRKIWQQYNSGGSIGKVGRITGSAKIERNGEKIPVTVGMDIQKGDIVETGENTQINLRFIDDTRFAVPKGVNLGIDEYVFDPDNPDAKNKFSWLRGVFVFTSNLIDRGNKTDPCSEDNMRDRNYRYGTGIRG